MRVGSFNIQDAGSSHNSDPDREEEEAIRHAMQDEETNESRTKQVTSMDEVVDAPVDLEMRERER